MAGLSALDRNLHAPFVHSQVVRQTQALPYARADCMLLPDCEEREAYRHTGTAAALSVADALPGAAATDGSTAGVPALGLSTLIDAASDGAAHAAAAAAAQWHAYEFATARATAWPDAAPREGG